LADRYDAFCEEFGPYVRRGRARRFGDADAFRVRTRLAHIFREFPVLDPELPEELAALGYARRRAVEIFHTLYEGLAEPSQRHFEAVVAAPGFTP
jgi:phenylacetic acid degradation operon negative regulatory protein